jgi:hypothetical protein
VSNFTVGYDDMYGLELWCKVCEDAGLLGKANLLPPNGYGTEYTLEHLVQLAGEHGHPVATDDGTCLAPHPGNPDVKCGRAAGHGPGDMHDNGYFTERIPHLWPNPADGK